MTHAGAADQTVLELRIHGVANTPPHGMLDLPPGEVEQCDGDGLGSFWVPTAAADARDRAPGTPAAPVDPGDLHAIRADVRREAYSWGAMARFGTFPLAGVVGAVARGLTRALWALNVPFGLANVAYWARRVPGAEDGAVHDPPARSSDETVPHARPEPTAAAVRVFGLALTLLLTAAVTTVAVVMVGARCMRPGAEGTDTVQVCARVPSVLDGLARMAPGHRAAVLSLVPVAVVVGLVLLARAGQVRFDERVSIARAGQRDGGSVTGPLLYRAGFWSRRVAGPAALLAHLAGAVALVAVLLAWTSDRTAAGTAAVAAGSLVLGLAVVVVGARNDDDGIQVTPPRWKGALAVATLVLAVVAWGLAAWASTRRTGTEPAAYVGVDVAPTVLGAVLTGIAASALLWRPRVPEVARRVRWRVALWSAVPVVVTGCLGTVAVARRATPEGAVATYGEATTRALVLVAVGVLAIPLVGALGRAARPVRSQGADRWVGWHGTGPGVLLLVATATAAVLTSLLVLGVQVYLTGGRAARPDPEGALLVDIVRTVPGYEELPVPSAYTEFGIGAVVLGATAVVGLLVLAVPALHDLVRSSTRWLPRAVGTTSDAQGPTGWAAAILAGEERTRTAGTEQSVADMPLAARRAVRTRQVAAVTHRAEIAVGVLALSSWTTLVVTVLLGRPGESVAGVWVLGGTWLTDLSVPLVGALAAALVASFVAAGSDGFARPWGLLWDLMCFLPRSAHPFGPPCYAERTVPEVAARVESWLAAADLPAAERPAAIGDRRVVLSAHSLGAVIATAVVLGRAGNPVRAAGDGAPLPRTDGDQRLGVVTYGVQLRAYFGRFFPSLLGPHVLGTPPCGAPRWRGDPWVRQTTNARSLLRAAVLEHARRERRGSAAAREVAAHEAQRTRVREARAAWRAAMTVADGVHGDDALLAVRRDEVAAAQETLDDERRTLDRFESAIGDPAEGERRQAAARAAEAAYQGVRGTRPTDASLTDLRRAADAAWSDASRGPGSARLDPATPTLVRLLRGTDDAPAWVNLWRRTDYLGFPVVSYTANAVDRGADEVDRGAYLFTVATHSTYFRAWAYHEALDTVLDRLGAPVPGHRRGGWHWTSAPREPVAVG
ncbi:hypothetical protein [Cellulosimicrobium sp. NPDC057862]|uniref:hypothetical protein n=1 Tax=Cellulosimicrobium sp. NPDC057862 TaxID=3346266 RepID=UPI003670BD13